MVEYFQACMGTRGVLVFYGRSYLPTSSSDPAAPAHGTAARTGTDLLDLPRSFSFFLLPLHREPSYRNPTRPSPSCSITLSRFPSRGACLSWKAHFTELTSGQYTSDVRTQARPRMSARRSSVVTPPDLCGIIFLNELLCTPSLRTWRGSSPVLRARTVRVWMHFERVSWARFRSVAQELYVRPVW
jgi:hypothetical protein